MLVGDTELEQWIWAAQDYVTSKTMSENDIYRTLYHNYKSFECLKGLRDLPEIHEQTKSLAREIYNYPNHKLWGPVKLLFKTLKQPTY